MTMRRHFLLSDLCRPLRQAIYTRRRSRLLKLADADGSTDAAQDTLAGPYLSEALSALPKHVQLILIWCTYLPLDDVLRLELSSFSNVAHLEDGTVAIYSLPGGLKIIPRDLYQMTQAYIVSAERVHYSPSKTEPVTFMDRLFTEREYWLTTAWNVRDYVKTALEVCRHVHSAHLHTREAAD